jgi:MFS family permease
MLTGLALPRDSKIEQKEATKTQVTKPSTMQSLREVVSNRGILLVSLLEAAQFLVFGAVEAFLALYAASVGIPAWQIGIILGVQLIGIVLIKPVMGTLSDRWGRRAVIFPGLLVGAASVGLLPLVHDVVWLSLLSVAFGVGYAMVTSSTSALVADLTRNGRFGASMGVLRTITDIGQTIGPVATGFLVAGFGYQVAFPVLASVLVMATSVFVIAPQLGARPSG